MASLGETLKEARLKKGLSLKELASKTRIQVHFLEAIEDNNLDVIPGSFFRKSFVRQYAEELGVDPKSFELDTTIQFGSYPANEDASKISLSAHEQPDLPPLPTPGRERSFPLRQVLLSVGLLVGVVAVCAVAFMVWEDFQVRQRQETASAEPPVVVPVPPAPTTPDSQGPRSETAAADLVSEEQAPPPAAVNAVSASATETTAPALSTEAPASTPAADVPRAEIPSTTMHGSGARELRLTADALTWVRVREGDRTIYMGTIDAGQSRIIRVAEGAQVLTGNAGSLKVFWQGNDVGKIGPSGQVRTVILTPDGFSIQAPAPKTSPPASDASSPSSSGEAR